MPDMNVSRRFMIEQAQLGYEFRQATLAWRGEITDAQRELSIKLDVMIRQAREQKLPSSGASACISCLRDWYVSGTMES
jgi:hypothetical protein